MGYVSANSPSYLNRASGTALSRAYTRGRLLSTPTDFESQIGYAPAALYTMNDGAHASGIRDSMSSTGATDLPAVGGISLYGRWSRKLQGVYIPTNGYGWGLAATHAPGSASMAVVGAFSMPAHNAADICLWGYADTGGGVCRLYAKVLTASDKVQIVVTDPAAAHNGSVTIDHALVFGDVYVLVYHINRTTGFLYTRLVNVNTGLGYDGTALDISAFDAITGASTPLFQVGQMTGIANGTTVTHLGLATITAGVTAADVVSRVTYGIAGI